MYTELCVGPPPKKKHESAAAWGVGFSWPRRYTPTLSLAPCSQTFPLSPGFGIGVERINDILDRTGWCEQPPAI